MGMIGLALLALVIATVVWLFERLQGSEPYHAGAEISGRETVAALPPQSDSLQNRASLACEDDAGGNAATL